MNFLLAIVLIVILSKVLGEIFERMGMSSLLGEFSAGIILGASFLNLIRPSDVEQFAYMGVILLMFLAGYEETNIRFLMARERRISTISVVSLVITLIALFGFSRYILDLTNMQSLMFAFVFGLTDVAVSANALLLTGKIETDVGESLLGIAVIDTVVGIILLAFTVAFISTSTFTEISAVLGKMLIFFLITIFIAKYLTKLVHKTVKMHTEKMEFSVAFASIFLLAYLADELNLAAVLGAYFAGLILQQSKDLASEHFSTTVKNIAYGFFISIFFAWVGLSTNLRMLPEYFFEAMLIAVVVIGVKVGIVMLMSLWHGSSLREAAVYGVGMSVKGADNIIVLAIALSVGVLFGEAEMFLASLFIVMVMSMIFATVGLRLLLPKAR